MIKLELQNSPIADSGRYITVDANFTEIKRDNMAYMACPSEGCQKKVTERSGGGGSYDCKSCGRVDGYKYRFIIKGSIADSTGYQWVTAFEDAGAMIFGMSANDLMEIREKKERDFHDRVDKVLFGKFRFRLRYKIESYNDQRRANVTVDKAEKIDQSTSEYLYDVEKQVEELKRCLNL
jgi:replication factor A1